MGKRQRQTAPLSGAETGHAAAGGQYRIGCSEAAVRRLIARLLEDDELHARFLSEPRRVLAEAGIELPSSVDIEPTAFERAHLSQLLMTPGPLLNLTIGGRPALRPRHRPILR